MLKTILLISPVFVALFWSITLAGNDKKHSAPRRFLGKFMLFPLVIYISHFLYFVPYPNIYPYFDVALQYASLLVFPIYYIYFRLLTIDNKFSIKVHASFLAIPTIILVFYGIGVLVTPSTEYRMWLFDEKAFPNSNYIKYLQFMRTIIRFTYLIQVVVTVAGNYFLIKKYGDKAEQYFSDIQDGRYNKANMLNYSIIVLSIAGFIFTALGRHFLINKDLPIYLGWSVFSATLFVIGYMGVTQKPINPAFDLDDEIEDTLQEGIPLTETQQKILDKILFLFTDKKIYLNSQLNILEIVNSVGTNRTYISTIINQKYHQNFCSFVNSYRMEELERVLRKNPEFTNEILAEFCGFGSINSLKRTIFAKTRLSVPEWKKCILEKN